MNHPSNCPCADHAPTNPSVTQTLEEMDFERSLHASALSGNLVKLTKQLQTCTNVNAFDASGYTALHYAARNGRVSCVKALVEAGVDIDLQTKGLGTTAVMRAVLGGHAEVVQFLMERGADLGIRDAQGREVCGMVKAGDESMQRILHK
ncbi:Ankyrin repeat domain-containing protein 39 [Podochytrium sp. JEL0797]|nr:Ankyrin repeat domain-containing protein 39 [Podochytrium sp. JEL0797]